MNTKPTKNKTTTASTEAENSDQILATAWLAFAKNPNQKTYSDALAACLNAELLRIAPDGSRNGVLRGVENELRQDALILLVGGFLVGNPDLRSATRVGRFKPIANQIRRSIHGAANAARNSLARQYMRESKRHSPLEDADNERLATPHESNGDFWSLPFEQQKELVFEALRQAVADGALRQTNADVSKAMIDLLLSQRELADLLGISPSAVNQQLKAVKKVLPRYLDGMEFPLP